MISLVLAQKIASLFLILILGFVLVRLKVLRSADARVLSLISMYLLTPCTLLSAFQVDCTDSVKRGLLAAVIAAIGIHILILLGNVLTRKLFHLTPVEQASVVYSNAGNLIIPLVSGVLGAEWVIYTCAFMAVQQILIWTHGKNMISGEKSFDLKKLLKNVNLISIAAGLILFFTGIRFPKIMEDSVDALGGMIGTVCMLITGMLIGGMELKNVFNKKKVYIVAALRLIAVPLMALAFIKWSGIMNLASNGKDVLLVTFLACTSPSASTVTTLADVYDAEPETACSINVITTLLCIATMPIMVWLYSL